MAHGGGVRILADSSTSLKDVKQICSKDITCVGFYYDDDPSWPNWIPCLADSKNVKDSGSTLYVKGKIK